MSEALGRLRDFIADFAALLALTRSEEQILDSGGRLLKDLVSVDDWLPAAYAQPNPERYRQYLLHCDSRQQFSVVAFVWGPGQSTPVHNHTVWGLIGMLRGAEESQSFQLGTDGLIPGAVRRLEPGQVEVVSPRVGDIHRVTNPLAHTTSISVHVYGANIGAVRRATFDAGGQPKAFISGYANDTLPNLWDLSTAQT